MKYTLIALIGFICGSISTSHADISECIGIEDCLAVHMESFEYDYHPRYEAPPMKPKENER